MKNPPSRSLITLALALLCLIWGTTWAVIQIGLAGIPPFSGVALRFGVAALILLALARFLHIKMGKARRERVLWWINGLLAFCVSYGVVYWSEQWVPSGLAAILFATNPLFVSLLAHWALPSESLNRAESIGILLGFVGVGVIFSEDFHALGGQQVRLAALVMLLSPLAAAIASVAVKRWGKGIHPFSLSAVPMGITAGIMGALAITYERGAHFDWNGSSIGALLYLAVFGSVITFTLYFWLLAHLPAKRLALIAYVIPLVAVGVGWLRGEPMTVRTLAGAALVVIGTALAVHLHSLQQSPVSRHVAADGRAPDPLPPSTETERDATIVQTR
jgi:drug/metabolite transporter (DMT)-like permease